MKLILDAPPAEYILAVRAAQAHLSRNANERISIITFENGSAFLVTKNKSSLTAKSVSCGRQPFESASEAENT